MTTTLKPKSLTRPVTEIPLEDIPATRAALVAEARELFDTRSVDGELQGADADLFRSIESAVGSLEYRSKALAPTIHDGRIAQLMRSGEEPSAPDAFRPAGLMPSLANMPEEELRSFHGQLMAGHSAHLELELRDVSATTAPMAAVPGQMFNPVPFSREPTRIASLLPTEPTTSASVTFYQQTTAASAAAPVLEGGDKPESNPGWTAQPVTIRKLAHFVDVTKESLDDFANMRQVIATEMNAGLINTENAQLLNGNGTSPNISGLLDASGLLTYAPAGAEAWYRSIRTGIRDLRTDDGLAEPDTIIIHPDDALEFDLSNDTSAGLHAVPDLTTSTGAPIWGLRRVETTGIAAGTALLMDSRRAAVLFVRQPPTLFADPYSQSSKNLVRVIVEERIGLGILNAACMLAITFNAGD